MFFSSKCTAFQRKQKRQSRNGYIEETRQVPGIKI